MLLFCAACGEDEPARRVDMSKRQETALPTPASGITYAYLPQYSHTTSYARHHLLVEYLAKATGLPIRQVFPDTFDEHVKMVAQGQIDISFTNPFVYIKLAQHGARGFARTIRSSGRGEFRCEIICRSDNRALKTPEDCRGKRWIAVDPLSAGGYLFALGYFHDLGIHKQDFAEITFAPGPGGKQENVVLAVLAGKYDFGTIREGTLDVLKDRIDPTQIRVLARTKAYPEWLFAARKGLDERVVEKVSRAMFALDPANPEHAAILKAAGLARIIPAKDQDCDPVRELIRKLELD
ncbi:MAG: phosphate/phosphite/phosphonate ABC transporter substrate-binding protein [Humidesulfovibrio sp.]|nr:phosphate/phosphite/phosphonate ABC transporter substrate-binding protein [Humidesulfovibrio sp.]